MNLDKQIAVVTGGASGMSYVCIDWFVCRGIIVKIEDKSPTDCLVGIILYDVQEMIVRCAIKKTIDQVGILRISINFK
jgi:hypothetical protein